MQPIRPATRLAAAAIAASVLASTAVAGTAFAGRRDDRANDRQNHSFSHVATFDVRANGTQVAEIVTSTRDGRTLLYSDSATGQIGFVDISDPAKPTPSGAVAIGGQPTSVATTKKYALAATDTSGGDLDRPTGALAVIDLGTRAVVKTFPLGGQPDSVAVSPDGRYAAVVLENQRDEEENGGLIPQQPGGQLVVIDLQGAPGWWPLRYVDFTGLPMSDASDPEPEFVDINGNNLAAVTFQENNHIAVVDVRNGKIVSDFSAGEVTVEGIDATEDEFGPQGNGIISLADTITRRREPDTIGWIDNDSFGTANEGDYEDAAGNEGGSRSFTIFNIDGTVEYEAGNAFEYSSIRAGHYNEGRSENKGGEPEALEFGKYGRDELLFVGSERANVIGVYDVRRGEPTLVQMLPSGIGPEGMKAIPERGLFVAASETSVDDLIPSMITIYQRGSTAAEYPQLVSDDVDGAPIPWVAMSGLAGDPNDADTLYGVSDSFLAEAGIYTIDVSSTPAVITDRFVVTDGSGVRHDLDLEGIAVDPQGGFWLASEGRNDPSSGRDNAIVKVDASGVVQQEVLLPTNLIADGWNSSGFEGLALSDDGAFVYAVIQREWPSDAGRQVKIGRYDVAAGTWAFVAYALDGVESPAGGWVGLSEITALGGGEFAIVERDNALGPDARIKRVYGVDLGTAAFAEYTTGAVLPVVDKTLRADLLDELAAHSVWTPDKLEGLAVAADGDVFVVTDNDGLDDAVGQTVFLNLGADALG